MTTTAFSINFDYRCPFARNGNERVLAALAEGAPYDVRFLPFSLTQVHVPEGEPAVFERREQEPDLVALAAGVVVRDRFPELFAAAHLALFAARHDDGEDLRDDDVVRNALANAGVDPEAVYVELKSGWPFDVIAHEHEAAVTDHAVFGVPTFVLEDKAVFIRLMTRPRDGGDSRAVIDHVLSLLSEHSELNEFKHTSVPR